MRVLNAMLSEGRGGIEAAFSNYAVALKAAGCEVTCCVTPGAAIAEDLNDYEVVMLGNRSQFDPLAIWRAAKLLRAWKPDVVLLHGRRAFLIFVLAQRLFGKCAPLVQVLHRPRFKNVKDADHVITVSAALRDQVVMHGVDAARVTHVPNFLPKMPVASPARLFNTPPVIGVLARMVPVKGLDLFIEALALLKTRGFSYTAKIGGSGADETALKVQAKTSGVADSITWLGWVHDADAFYHGIDIFCLPSRAESFGLVVIEAFAQGKLVVSTRTSGPSEMITDGANGLLCDVNADAIANALERAMTQDVMPMVTQAMVDKETYSLETVAPQIAACLRVVSHRFLANGESGAAN